MGAQRHLLHGLMGASMRWVHRGMGAWARLICGCTGAQVPVGGGLWVYLCFGVQLHLICGCTDTLV